MEQGRVWLAGIALIAFVVGGEAAATEGGPIGGEVVQEDGQLSQRIWILEEVAISTDCRGDRLEIPGFLCGGAPGEPELPVRHLNFLLPPDVDPETVQASLEDEMWEEILGTFQIPPAPPPVILSTPEHVVTTGRGHVGNSIPPNPGLRSGL